MTDDTRQSSRAREDIAKDLLDQATWIDCSYGPPPEVPTALLREAAAALTRSESAARDQAYDHFKAFWEKYGLGSKICPSCLMCGQQRQSRDEWAITHAELPDIYICMECVSKTTRSMVAQPEALNHIRIWTSRMGGPPCITLEIPGEGFWSYHPENDDPDGGAFMLQFKEKFGIQGLPIKPPSDGRD